MATYEETYYELEQYDEAYVPSERPENLPGLKILPDGDYDFEILGAELTRTTKTNDLILKMVVRVLTPGQFKGQIVERPSFFKSQTNIDFLGSELCTLGFDADQWKAPSRPFSRELPKILPKLKGIRFTGKKVTSESGTFHNLYIQARASGKPMPASKPAPAQKPAMSRSTDDIPF